jgi:hypothetical protein
VKKNKPVPLPEDTKALQELRSVLVNVSDLPQTSQWEMAMELLSDEFLSNFINARKRRREEERMTMYGPLALTLVQYYLREQTNNAEYLMTALIGLTYSVYGELERRHKKFCSNVVFMDDPIFYDPENPVLFIPNDPETFDVEALFTYYNENTP